MASPRKPNAGMAFAERSGLLGLSGPGSNRPSCQASGEKTGGSRSAPLPEPTLTGSDPSPATCGTDGAAGSRSLQVHGIARSDNSSVADQAIGM